jgi:hypothetical protein
LPLLDDQGELFTFVVSGKAAIREAGSLSRAYARHRKTWPNDFPIIALNVGSYQHRDRAIGRVKFPELNIVGWAPKTDFMNALAAAGLVPVEEVNEAMATPATQPSEEEPPPILELPPEPEADDFF